MNYCYNCGEKVEKKQKFCPNCGNKIANNENIESEDKSKAIVCPYCHSTNMDVQIIAKNKNAGCLTILLYILIAMTIVGIPIMILYLLLKGNKTQVQKYYVCKNCGKTYVPKMSTYNKTLLYIIAFFLFLLIFSAIITMNN